MRKVRNQICKNYLTNSSIVWYLKIHKRITEIWFLDMAMDSISPQILLSSAK